MSKNYYKFVLSSIQHYVFWLQRCIDVQGNVFEHLLNS